MKALSEMLSEMNNDLAIINADLKRADSNLREAIKYLGLAQPEAGV